MISFGLQRGYAHASYTSHTPVPPYQKVLTRQFALDDRRLASLPKRSLSTLCTFAFESSLSFSNDETFLPFCLKAVSAASPGQQGVSAAFCSETWRTKLKDAKILRKLATSSPGRCSLLPLLISAGRKQAFHALPRKRLTMAFFDIPSSSSSRSRSNRVSHLFIVCNCAIADWSTTEAIARWSTYFIQ